MKILQFESGSATIQLSKSDLIILANAINETQEALEDWEFSTRVGADPSDAESLRHEIKELLSLMK